VAEVDRRRVKTALILGITSDIGRELAVRFVADDWAVVGTYRQAAHLSGLPSACRVFPCDVESRPSVDDFLDACARANVVWDAVVVAVGTEEPIGSFWESDEDEWERGITVNALAPLRILRKVYRLRNPTGRPCVIFFSGAGTNSAAPAYSAYCASKILLIKMCELLDAESPDTSFVIIGPGIVRTKIHEQTLLVPGRSGANYRKVVDFLGSGHPGTSHDDIYACVQWCIQAEKDAVGGRNISLVYDVWRDGKANLTAALCRDPELYKLRRFGNDLALGGGT
jgi:NAD(P)-dependent dehydrogenase (short-subunit alcohol dehydrogenase family)